MPLRIPIKVFSVLAQSYVEIYGMNCAVTGPPQDKSGSIISPSIDSKGQCNNGWVCEHRWNPIFKMVNFRNVVSGSGLNNWWDNGNNQIAFCRGNRGFIAFNGEPRPFNTLLDTCLPPGMYCDIISGENQHGRCTGVSVNVGSDGKALINISNKGHEGVLAIHVGSKVSF